MISTRLFNDLRKRLNKNSKAQSSKRKAGKVLLGVLSFEFWALSFGFPFNSFGASDFPVYVTTVPNPNDYGMFANSGWDGNWYVGFNNCWIKKLPPIPPGNYARAYVGAKLGRMKSLGPIGRPPEFPAIAGTFRMAISSTAAWKSSESVEIASADEIPLEGHAEIPMDGTGESQWFWAQVPLARINPQGDNFLVVWSPTPAYIQVSSAPVLAAAMGGKSADSWLCKDNAGSPPARETLNPDKMISFFQPALALRLIPVGAPHPVAVRLVSWRPGTPENPKPIITVNVIGESIERAWVEYAVKDDWKRTGRPLWKAPYIFTVDPRPLPRGRLKLRVAATNIWGETAASDAFAIEVGEKREKN